MMLKFKHQNLVPFNNGHFRFLSTLDPKLYISSYFKCANLSHVHQVHAQAIATGLIQQLSIANKIMYEYTLHRAIVCARALFRGIIEKNAVSWSSMIGGFAKAGDCLSCYSTFREYMRYGYRPDKFTLPSVIKACRDEKDLVMSRVMHSVVCKFGFQGYSVVATVIVDMYAKCEAIDDAKKVFDEMPQRDLVTWTLMIGACTDCGNPQDSLDLFDRMRNEGVMPDKITMANVATASAKLGAMHSAKIVHDFIGEMKFSLDAILETAIIDMHAKCGNIELAREIFDTMRDKNVVSWSSMIGGFAKAGDYLSCYSTFREYMRSGYRPNKFNLPSVIKACRDEKDLVMGRVMHSVVCKFGFQRYSFVAAVIVDMYAKCKAIDDAKKLFDEMIQRDLVTWAVMIGACTECGNPQGSMDLFDRMRNEGVMPDNITMVKVANASAKLGAMHKAKIVHDFIGEMKFSLDAILENAIIDMHAKCGNIELAREIFDTMRDKNVISWSTMIAAYGYHGEGEKALDLFHTMLKNGILPDSITFVSLLYSCSHSGLVEEGLRIFSLIENEYGVKPNVKHFTCVVDLLGRAGKLDQALEMIEDMNIEKGVEPWRALLGACRLHERVEMAEKAAKSLLELQPENGGHYVLLSNIYAKAGKWNEVAKVREMMTHRRVKKITGWTWIEVGNKIHRFSVGDYRHYMSKEIYEELKCLRQKIEVAGYKPDTNFVLHDIEEELKVEQLNTHSEKLAIAFGLMGTPEGTVIRITKNLRVCGDCHTFMKFVSLVENRVIVVRDASRFHHFKDGDCSCRDYW